MQQVQYLTEALAEAEIQVLSNEPLKSHTSFRVGGPAAVFCEPYSVQQIAQAVQLACRFSVPYYFLGKGSNVIFPDQGYPGLIIHIGSAFSAIEVQGDTLVAQAGAPLEQACRAAESHSLAGLEFAYGIPGSVGGALYMNAGAFGGEMQDVVKSCRYLDAEGTVQVCSVEAMQLQYRGSIFQKQPWCILDCTFQLAPGQAEQITEKMQDFMQRRRDKQPLELPSAGSAFKRPPGAFAGQLIDECGLRGYRIGDAAISEKHCGFIVNLGNATCDDIMALADHVAETVREKTGYILEKEVRVVRV